MLSILLNSIVILVILDMRKPKITSSARLFVALAVSDIVMAVPYVLGAVMNWRYNSCTASEAVSYGIDITTIVTGPSNKGVTFYESWTTLVVTD